MDNSIPISKKSFISQLWDATSKNAHAHGLVWIQGLVVNIDIISNERLSISIDDGTGVIAVNTPTPEYAWKVGDYVMAIGPITVFSSNETGTRSQYNVMLECTQNMVFAEKDPNPNLESLWITEVIIVQQ